MDAVFGLAFRVSIQWYPARKQRVPHLFAKKPDCFDLERPVGIFAKFRFKEADGCLICLVKSVEKVTAPNPKSHPDRTVGIVIVHDLDHLSLLLKVHCIFGNHRDDVVYD
jgi:hypothetical protein